MILKLRSKFNDHNKYRLVVLVHRFYLVVQHAGQEVDKSKVVNENLEN